MRRPCEKDFNIPTSREEWEEMKMKLGQCGVDEETAKTMMKKRWSDFEKAKKEYNDAQQLSPNPSCQQESQH